MSYLKSEFYTIDCLTNMLVGSGKANYGVIDQLVQRDAVTHIPIIHASGLKGAIKEFCTHNNKQDTTIISDGDIKKVFGSVKPKKDEAADVAKKATSTGEYKFLDAHLLYLPVRSDKRAFVHITCPLVLQQIINQINLFEPGSLSTDLNAFANLITDIDSHSEAYCFNGGLNEAILEDFEFKAAKHPAYVFHETLKKLFNDNIVITSNYIFQTLTNDLHLPVIARNHLENGESENLWYEQVIPRTSRFWFTMLKPSGEFIQAFDDLLIGENSVIQIGANATVGYGYTKINSLNF